MVCPVIKAASFESKKATVAAISSGFPARPKGGLEHGKANHVLGRARQDSHFLG
jgi:hypothetical protein